MCVRFSDVCVGLFLLISSSLFLWLRGSSKTFITSAVLGLFLVNTFRVILVILVLRTYGYSTAAIVHDAFYIGFTEPSSQPGFPPSSPGTFNHQSELKQNLGLTYSSLKLVCLRVF